MFRSKNETRYIYIYREKAGKKFIVEGFPASLSLLLRRYGFTQKRPVAAFIFLWRAKVGGDIPS